MAKRKNWRTRYERSDIGAEINDVTDLQELVDLCEEKLEKLKEGTKAYETVAIFKCDVEGVVDSIESLATDGDEDGEYVSWVRHLNVNEKNMAVNESNRWDAIVGALNDYADDLRRKVEDVESLIGDVESVQMDIENLSIPKGLIGGRK